MLKQKKPAPVSVDSRKNPGQGETGSREYQTAGRADSRQNPEQGDMDSRKNPAAGSADSRKNPGQGGMDSSKNPAAGSADSGKNLDQGNMDSRQNPEQGNMDSGQDYPAEGTAVAGQQESAPGAADNGQQGPAPGTGAGESGSGAKKGLLLRLLTSEGMRYLFIGGCTTLVNLVIYTVLCRVVHLNVNVSNIISIIVAILFAYVTNKLIVFRSHCGSFAELASECARFIGARLATMAIEVGGVFLLYQVLHKDEIVAKLATQVLVIIGNYFISRFIVFRDRK